MSFWATRWQNRWRRYFLARHSYLKAASPEPNRFFDTLVSSAHGLRPDKAHAPSVFSRRGDNAIIPSGNEEQAMRIGVLTGGGDCPGLNAVIRAVVRKGCFHYEDEFVGFLEGWRGLVEDKTMKLDLESVAGILPRGGTILRTSRTNPAKHVGVAVAHFVQLVADKSGEARRRPRPMRSRHEQAQDRCADRDWWRRHAVGGLEAERSGREGGGRSKNNRQ